MRFIDRETSYDGFFESARVPSENSQLPTIPRELSNISFYDNEGNVAKVYRARNGQFIVQVDQANGMESYIHQIMSIHTTLKIADHST